MSELAYLGGTPAIKKEDVPKKQLFGWPIITSEDENAAELYSAHTVLVQGVIDCLIVCRDGSLRLVDYKTDRLKTEEKENEALAEKRLRDRHYLQLSYYALAVEKIFGRRPDKVEVYSLALGRSIDITR